MNVAVAAARLGTPTGFLTQLSTDLFGNHLLGQLQSSGVDTRLLLRSDLPTTLAFTRETQGDVEFEFRSRQSADANFDPRPRPQLPDSLSWLHFGSISLLQEPAAAAIVDIVKNFEGYVFFDPNIRPALIADRANYLLRLEEWVALSDVVKMSTQDLEWLEAPVEPLIGRWLEGRPQAVVITDGSRGASAFLRSG